MRRRIWIAAGLAVLATQWPSLARAQPATQAPGAEPPAPQQRARAATPYGAPVVDPTVHRHDGFFLRMLLGPGGFTTAATISGNDFKVSGGGGGLSIALGGAVNPSLIVYGEVFDDVAVGPTLTENGQNQGTAGNNVSAGVVGIGPGIAFYTASNFYLSATLALSRISIQQNGNDIGHSGNGYGVSGAIGKEWWASAQWGLGLAGQVYVGSIPDGQADARWTTVGAMVAFSATLN